MPPTKADDNTKEVEEDEPIVKELKVVDDKYRAINDEYEKERATLQQKFEALQKPLLDERKNVLIAEKEGEKTGTPQCKGFWLQAMKNHNQLEDQIQEWDEPILECLSDVTQERLFEDNIPKGFRLTFHFANGSEAWFDHTTLNIEYTEKFNPYNGNTDVVEIKADEIVWKEGKDITMEKVKKVVKGGGAKKAKQKAKEGKEEPRKSIFREWFRSLKKGDTLPEDLVKILLDGEEMDDDDDDQNEAMLECYMDNVHECGGAIQEQIIPFAVRWYTGEAAPDEDDDDDDDDDDEDDDDDDDDDDEDSDDEPPKKGKKQNKKKGSPGGGPAKDPKQEECKQQ